jgi:hypothetical protein
MKLFKNENSEIFPLWAQKIENQKRFVAKINSLASITQ